MILNKFSKFLPQTTVKKCNNFTLHSPCAIVLFPEKSLPGPKITHWTSSRKKGLIKITVFILDVLEALDVLEDIGITEEVEG
jgi:hypothetical protein